jgi:hypothetical protein
MPILHLGQLQLEVRCRPFAGMMIPPVGEQDTPDIQKQRRDLCRAFHYGPPEFPLLSRLRPQFLERTQESDDIFLTEHALNLPIHHHGRLVDSITVHLFQGRP